MPSIDHLLRTPATLQEGTLQTKSSSGEDVVAWANFSAEMVMLRQAQTRDNLLPGNVEEVSHIVFCRYLPDLAAAPQGRWRFLIDGETYMVVRAHDPAGYNHHMEIKVRHL